MDDQDYYIPRRLNDPLRLFFWDFDVAVIFLGALVLGLQLGTVMVGVVLGLVLARGYSRLKAGKHPAYALHLSNWALPFAVGKGGLPPGYLREFVG